MSSVFAAMTRRAVRLLRSRRPETPVFSRLTTSYRTAQMIVRFYYAASAYVSANIMVEAARFVRNTQNWDFVWPLSWVDATDPGLTLRLITAACFVCAILCVVFVRSAVVRALFSVFFLFACSIINSRGGGINHPYHAWFWISFILIFLPAERRAPSGAPTRATAMSYLTVVMMAQTVLLFFYTMSGAWKVAYGIASIFTGIEGAFSFKGLAYQLADRIDLINTDPLLAHFVIDNYLIAWVGFLGVMYMQLTAIAAAFRPRLHRVWGLAIICFHLGTWLLMEIIFTEHVLLLTMLLVMSPFAPRRFAFDEVVGDLPLLGPYLLKGLAWARRRRAPAEAEPAKPITPEAGPRSS